MAFETGLERLIGEHRQIIGGRRVGLASHPAAVLPDMTPAVHALRKAGVQVTALFGPEHGFGGAVAEGGQIGHATDPRTGLPVYSMYGPAKEPTADMLAGVDVLVFDMQDVGVRYYTYISTLFYVLRGAAAAGVPVIVLDRPNPLGGVAIEGPLIAPGHESFVGIAPIPVRHGLTVGEIARYLNTTFALGAELEVVAMRGWRREQWFEELGRPWVPTSPAMAHLSAVALYPGTCLLEGTNLALGRGTALAFEVCGAPWIDGEALAEALNTLDMPGVRFRPLRFSSALPPYPGQECGGVQAHVTDRHALRPVLTGLHMVAQARAHDPAQFAWQAAHFDRLIGNAVTRAAVEAGEPVELLAESWRAGELRFAHERQSFLLYE